MSRGKWYLIYNYDVLYGDGSMCIPEEYRIPLEATTEDEAIAEAKTKWENLDTFKNKYEKKYHSEEKPYGPNVVHEIPL